MSRVAAAVGVALVLLVEPCLAYSNPATFDENAEWADVIVLGKLVEIVYGPETGAPQQERAVFLRIEVEERLKYHTYGLETILAVFTTPAVDRPVGDHRSFDQSQVGQRLLLFLGLAPISGSRGGYHRLFLLNDASQVVDGKIKVLTTQSPWTFEEMPLGDALETLKRRFNPREDSP